MYASRINKKGGDERRMEMGMEKRILKATWGCDGNLEPLYELDDKGDGILITFDLPRVRKENVEITTTEDTVEVIAKMSDVVCWERWGSVQRRITFQTFRKLIRLPEAIDPERARASFRNGILQIRLPKEQRKVLVNVE